MPIQERCRILDHQQVGVDFYRLKLVSPYISSHCGPGQFVEVRCSESWDPLWRRPLSIHQASAEHQTFELLYEVVGRGTELLTKYFVGEELDILGPLGNGFKIDPGKKIHILVGGGMGVAPLRALAEAIRGQGSRVKGQENALYVLMGAKTKELIVEEAAIKAVTDQVLVSTDDGTYGKKGLISDLLLAFLNDELRTSNLEQVTIYACGPKAMLRAVAEVASQKKIDCQLSMEERMACGVGACKGCVIKTARGYKLACKDGPVFDAREVVWS